MTGPVGIRLKRTYYVPSPRSRAASDPSRCGSTCACRRLPTSRATASSIPRNHRAVQECDKCSKIHSRGRRTPPTAITRGVAAARLSSPDRTCRHSCRPGGSIQGCHSDEVSRRSVPQRRYEARHCRRNCHRRGGTATRLRASPSCRSEFPPQLQTEPSEGSSSECSPTGRGDTNPRRSTCAGTRKSQRSRAGRPMPRSCHRWQTRERRPVRR